MAIRNIVIPDPTHQPKISRHTAWSNMDNAMLFWNILYVFSFGCLGGLINAYLVDRGFVFPRVEKLEDGRIVFRPGWWGNLFAGGFAAMIIWGLYGSVGVDPVLSLTFRDAMVAILTGMGWSSVLAREMEKFAGEQSDKNLKQALDRLTGIDERLSNEKKGVEKIVDGDKVEKKSDEEKGNE